MHSSGKVAKPINMYAQLGNIVFERLVGFYSFDHTKEANIVEHALIDGRPRLQRVGTNLDKVRIDILFHVAFCSPEEQIKALDSARDESEIMPFVLGNGENIGTFVIKSTTVNHKHLDSIGNIIEASVSVDLMEHYESNPLATAFESAVSGAFANAQNSPAQVGLSPQAAVVSASEAVKASQCVVATASSAEGINVALEKTLQFPAQGGYQLSIITEQLSNMTANVSELQAIISSVGPLEIVTYDLNNFLPTLISSVNAMTAQATAGSLSGVSALNSQLQGNVSTMRQLSTGLAALKGSR